MTSEAEQRTCRRFAVPHGQVVVLIEGYERAHPLVNLSRGGVAFACTDRLSHVDDVAVMVLVPREPPLQLRGRVRWQGAPAPGMDTLVGVEFKPFGRGEGWNPPETLQALCALELRYTVGVDTGE